MILKQEKVKKGLKCCGRASEGFPQLCNNCPYRNEDTFGIEGAACQKSLINDAYEVFIKQIKEEKSEEDPVKNPMYVLQIYDKKQQDVLFDEDDFNPLVERTTNKPAILLHLWRGYLAQYTGNTYYIKEITEDRLIISGIMNANDIYKLQECFYNIAED